MWTDSGPSASSSPVCWDPQDGSKCSHLPFSHPCVIPSPLRLDGLCDCFLTTRVERSDEGSFKCSYGKADFLWFPLSCAHPLSLCLCLSSCTSLSAFLCLCLSPCYVTIGSQVLIKEGSIWNQALPNLMGCGEESDTGPALLESCSFTPSPGDL